MLFLPSRCGRTYSAHSKNETVFFCCEGKKQLRSRMGVCRDSSRCVDVAQNRRLSYKLTHCLGNVKVTPAAHSPLHLADGYQRGKPNALKQSLQNRINNLSYSCGFTVQGVL